ncbi:hypothetical protein [Kribbella sp. CA-294648]|uniref:hypothetical protein n=1 Tax=Kribbella sp. CA-294648 TaxID=3239948 RepID=UPI003D8B9E96
MSEQPVNEPAAQTVERELQAAQAQVRDVEAILRAALAEDQRLAAPTREQH